MLSMGVILPLKTSTFAVFFMDVCGRITGRLRSFASNILLLGFQHFLLVEELAHIVSFLSSLAGMFYTILIKINRLQYEYFSVWMTR